MRPPARTTVEQCLALRVTELARAGVFRAAPGALCICQWTNGSGQEIRRISFRLVVDHRGASICFNYRVDGSSGLLRIQTEMVPVTSTPCHFGGSRPWVRCPLCGRRVGVLYARPNESRFLCRQCQHLAYFSAQSHDARIDALLRLPIGAFREAMWRDARKFGTLGIRVAAVLRRRIERRAARHRSPRPLVRRRWEQVGEQIGNRTRENRVEQPVTGPT